MAKKNSNAVVRENKVENWLKTRLVKILEHRAVTEQFMDEMIGMIEAAKANIKDRELKRIDEEIARLEELKKTLK